MSISGHCCGHFMSVCQRHSLFCVTVKTVKIFLCLLGRFCLLGIVLHPFVIINKKDYHSETLLLGSSYLSVSS